MKKLILILFIILASVCAFLFFLKHQKSQRTIQLNKFSEAILGYSLPDGYITIAATQKKPSSHSINNTSSVALLSGENEHTILIVVGPPLKNIKDQKDLLLTIHNNLYHINNNKFTNYAIITPSKEKPVDNPELLTYDMTIESQENTLNGIASFLNYPDKSILYICLAPKNTFIRQTAIDFLDELDAHNNAIYQTP